MTKFLITFPSVAMAALTEDELAAASADSHTVIEEAKAAGVYVFGGGIDEGVDPVLVAGDGTVSAETHPGSPVTGGVLVLELPSRDDAVQWSAKIAAACRCPQELRAFMYDPAS
ncbi:transcription initiation protein [Demequina muriae]|uniref:Transcription initiation protein n=1 Tax=Demequina muriae TaxID=3051664 RepID=A0ABT8GJ45_9MICO|nr:transcription initiation protein [Demequina sp. EGI L300058]MDN4481264.1 transcription initiation protein [Demequina sp. EGI L300058]